MASVTRLPDYNRFVDKSTFPATANDRCVVNRLRNSSTNNAINRGILGGSPKNQQSLMHSSRKRITFGDDETSSSSQQQQQSAGMTYLGGNSSAFQSLLFDAHANPSNQQPTARPGTTSFTKEEHDSPRNGVRKDVKLISDAAETEELFGRFLSGLVVVVVVYDEWFFWSGFLVKDSWL